MTRNHHLEIEGGMLASASPGVVKNGDWLRCED